MSNKIEMLTVEKCAELVGGLTKFRIRQMIKDGTLPYLPAGKKFLVNKTVLLRTIGEIAE
jgi:excisionase family DNA binding protein